MQSALRLEISRVKGQPQNQHLFNQRLLNGKEKFHKIDPAKIFADLLKRQARRICRDVASCDSANISAHVARLDDLREIISHALLHDFRETAEAVMNDFPLTSTYTLRDHLEAILHTRKTHRCPAFVNWRDSELATMHDKIDQIAGILSTPELQKRLMEESEVTL